MNESEGVPYVEGELIVKFHEENVNLTTYMGEYSLDTMAQSLSLETVTTDENSNSALLSMEEKSEITSFFSLSESTSNETTRELIEKVQEDPRVEYAQPNYVYYAQAMPNDPAFSVHQANLYKGLNQLRVKFSE